MHTARGLIELRGTVATGVSLKDYIEVPIEFVYPGILLIDAWRLVMGGEEVGSVVAYGLGRADVFWGSAVKHKPSSRVLCIC